MPKVDIAKPLTATRQPARSGLLDRPILRTLLSLAWPNGIALGASTCVTIAETSYIGRLGVETLAAMALVFPCVMLTITMSSAAMGTGVTSSIARALGAGDLDRASQLATHALLIGICFGLVFMLGMLSFSAAVLGALGGRGDVLAQATGYSQFFFGGAVILWLMNAAAGILRGTGNMKLPSLMIVSSAGCQAVFGGVLGLGLGPVPPFGMRGVAAGAIIAYTISLSVMGWYLFAGHAPVVPKIRGLRVQWAMFHDILSVGAVACLGPIQTMLTMGIFTHMLAGLGKDVLAGYGIGARLDYMLVSLAFAIGIASVPMIGMAIGAEQVARARRVVWITGCVSFVSAGAVGAVIAIVPELWVDIFTDDAGVRAAGRQYLAINAPIYGFLGLATSMYFSSQGAAKVMGPILAQSVRLLTIALGGWWLSTHGAIAADFFILAAASMVLFGVLSWLSVILTRWDTGGRQSLARARRCPAPPTRQGSDDEGQHFRGGRFRELRKLRAGERVLPVSGQGGSDSDRELR